MEETMYRVKEDIAFSQQDEKSLLVISVLDTENCYYKLTGLGSKVLLQIKEGADIEKIKTNLLEEFDVDAATVDRDVDNLINYLLENKIIETK